MSADLPGPPKNGARSGALRRWMPGLAIFGRYRREWLVKDIVAGLVLTSLLVPAGMGYAQASGLPAITGLYATIIPLLAYAIFGPSRILVLGPDSGLSAMIAATIVGLAAGDEARAVGLASMLAILTGLACVAAGIARAGFLTDLLSKPVRVGYMNGIGLTVLVTQFPKLCGFSVKSGGVLEGGAGILQGIAEGRFEPAAIMIGGGSLALILLLRALAPKIPGILIAVALATVATAGFGLSDRISVVGVLPRGLPSPALPPIDLADAGQLVVAALGIALVSFADTSVLSRTLAAKHGYRVDPNQELIALGAANIAAGLFRGFPISSSASRTPVAVLAGSRTQLTGVVGALAITGLLLLAPGLTSNLPTAALAAVVVSAILQVFDFGAFAVFRRVRRSDLFVSVASFLGVALLGVIPGIVLAIGISILDFVRRAWRPHDAILGRAPGVKGYHDITRYPDARQIPGLVLFRWDAPLFFANADGFRARIFEIVEAAPSPITWIIVAAEPMTDVDSTAAEMLEELAAGLSARGIQLGFAEMKDPVKDRLNRYRLQKAIGTDHFFPTIGVAVKAFLERTKIDWVDWEDSPPANPPGDAP